MPVWVQSSEKNTQQQKQNPTCNISGTCWCPVSNEVIVKPGTIDITKKYQKWDKPNATKHPINQPSMGPLRFIPILDDYCFGWEPVTVAPFLQMLHTTKYNKMHLQPQQNVKPSTVWLGGYWICFDLAISKACWIDEAFGKSDNDWGLNWGIQKSWIHILFFFRNQWGQNTFYPTRVCSMVILIFRNLLPITAKARSGFSQHRVPPKQMMAYHDLSWLMLLHFSHKSDLLGENRPASDTPISFRFCIISSLSTHWIGVNHFFW